MPTPLSHRPDDNFEAIMLECLDFLHKHFWHFVLLIPAMLLFTVLHESAHALLVVWEGGEILEFSVWPQQEVVHHPAYGRYTEWEWGHVSYHLDDEVSEFFIAIAPYLLMLGFMGITVLLALGKPLAFWLASSVFVWLYVAPCAEIGNELLPYLFDYEGDLFAAFARPSKGTWLLAAVWFAATISLGYWLQMRLYQQAALSLSAYTLLAGIGFLLFAVLVV